MSTENQSEVMKVYRPKSGPPVFAYTAIGILALVIMLLGYQNLSFRNQIKDLETQKENQEIIKEEEKIISPETLELNQQNLTEDWRIYKNLTYKYKFRVPKAYLAKVNNSRNSVEVFNEGNQRTTEIMVEPRSNTNTGDEYEKKESVGTILFNVKEFAEGNKTVKTPHVIYKTANDKYVFNIYFYNSVTLNEMDKLILTTFSEIEQ